MVDCINGCDSSFLPHVRAFAMKSPQKYVHPILPDPTFSIMNHCISYFYTSAMLRPEESFQSVQIERLMALIQWECGAGAPQLTVGQGAESKQLEPGARLESSKACP